MDKFIVKRPRVESVDDGESSPPSAQSALVTTDNVQSTSGKTQQTKTTSSKKVAVRKFKSDWLATYTWLSYDKEVDKAFCKTC